MNTNHIRRPLAHISTLFLLPASAHAQVAPESPIHTTVNGAFYLCPRLIGTEAAPPTEELSKLGFEATAPLVPGRGLWFKGDGGKGNLTVSYDPAEKRCTLDYVGAGYEQIAGIARDMVEQNRFVRITGGDRDGAKGDVFEGAARGRAKIARFIIIENYTDGSAAISYSER